MGLGWHLARDGQTRWHNGQTGGYHAMMLVNRQLETGVVLLTNTATMEVDRLAEDIIRMCAGAPVEPRTFDKPVPVAKEIMQRYVGKYELIPGFVLTVSVEDEKLMVGATGQPSPQFEEVHLALAAAAAVEGAEAGLRLRRHIQGQPGSVRFLVAVPVLQLVFAERLDRLGEAIGDGVGEPPGEGLHSAVEL